MRILVNFMHRESWTVHCLLEDCQTPISPHVFLHGDSATLIRMLRYVGAGDEEIGQVETDVRRWGRGSVFLSLAPGRKNLMQIRQPWSGRAGLV